MDIKEDKVLKFLNNLGVKDPTIDTLGLYEDKVAITYSYYDFLNNKWSKTMITDIDNVKGNING